MTGGRFRPPKQHLPPFQVKKKNEKKKLFFALFSVFVLAPVREFLPPETFWHSTKLSWVFDFLKKEYPTSKARQFLFKIGSNSKE